MPESPVFNDSDEFTSMPLPTGVVSAEEASELTPIPFQFSDIQALAARILKRAQEQAQQKLEAARKQIAALEKEAEAKAYKEAFPKGEKEGFAKGEADGKAAGKAEVDKAVATEKSAFRQNTGPVVSVLEQLAVSINQERHSIVAQAEADLLLLAMDIAKRLIGRELTLDADAIRPLANEAIGLVTDRSNLILRINPGDIRVLEEELPNLRTAFPDLGPLKLEPDAAIERGGLIVASREAEVDMRLAIRLAAFEEAILGYSGKDAEAPWNGRDPEEAAQELAAIEAARAAANEASHFALPPSPHDDTVRLVAPKQTDTAPVATAGDAPSPEEPGTDTVPLTPPPQMNEMDNQPPPASAEPGEEARA